MSDSKFLLNDELEALLTGHYGSCTFINDVPSDWGVSIIEVGCKFIDDNGNNDNKSATTNLGGSGSSYTLNSTYSGCCRSYFGIAKVRDRGKIEIYPFSKTVDSGYCGGNLRWHLVPAKVMAIGTSEDSQRLELVEG